MQFLNEPTTRYFLIAMLIMLFVILYVWQNIGVMKIKMEYQNLRRMEMEMIRKNDRLRYEIERFRRMEVVENYAQKNGMKNITPQDFDLVVYKGQKEK
mgnify:FL=1